MPNESCPSAYAGSMAACRAGLGGVRRVAGGAGEAVYGRVPAPRRKCTDMPNPPQEGSDRRSNEDTGAAATPDEQSDTAELRGEPVVQGVRPEISEPAVMEPRCTADSSTRPCLGATAAVRAGSGTACVGTWYARPTTGRGGCGTRCNDSAGTSGRTTLAGWVRRIAVQCFRYADRTGSLSAERTAGTGFTLYDLFRVLSRRTQSVNRPRSAARKPKGKRQAAGMPQVRHRPAQQDSATSSQKASKPCTRGGASSGLAGRLMQNQPHQEKNDSRQRYRPP